MECRENGGQQESRRVVGEPDPKPPRATGRNELHAANGLLDLFDDLPRLAEELGARRCKPGKTMALPCEQAYAYLLFKPCYLFGQRRLRDLQPTSGTTQIQLLGSDHKISQMAELNVSVPDIGQTVSLSRPRLSFKSHHYRC